MQDKKKKNDSESSSTSEEALAPKEEDKEEKVISLRTLNMEDMRQAKNQVTHNTSNLIYKQSFFPFLSMVHIHKQTSTQIAGCSKFRFRGVDNERIEAVERVVR